jgi:hypothetical protein
MAAVQGPIETRVGGDHQLENLPKLMAQLGWDEGTVVRYNILDHNTIVLMRVPVVAPPPEGWAAHFAGKLGDVFGDHDEIMAFLEEERRSWEPEGQGDTR